MKTRFLRRAGALLLALALACSLLAVPAAASEVTSITLPSDIRLNLTTHRTELIRPYFFPADATNTKLIWQNDSPAIVSIDQDTGLVTADAPGRAYIYAVTAEGTYVRSSDCFVTVEDTGPPAADVQSVTLDKSTMTMKIGDSQLLRATVSPSAASQAVTWRSSSSAVSVDSNGLVTALAPGLANITATSVADDRRFAIC